MPLDDLVLGLQRFVDRLIPRAGDAARVERAQAAGRRGILEGGASYGCVFTGGADDNLFTFANMKRPSGTGLVAALTALIVLAWVALKSSVITILELARAVLRPRGPAPFRARRLRGFLHDAGGAAGGSRAPGRAPSPRQRHQGPAHGPRARVLPALLQLHRGRLSVGARRAEGGARARQRSRHRGGPERVHLLRGRRRAAAHRPHRGALARAGRGSVAAPRRRVRLRAERRRAAVLLAGQALAAQRRRARSVRRPSGRGVGRRRRRRPHGHAERRRLRRLRHRRRARPRLVHRRGGRPRGALARGAARVRAGAARRPASGAARPSGPALPALRAISRGPRARVRGVTPITIASYNIHRGVGLDRRRDLDRIGVVIAEMNPDIIGLQEVIREDGNVMPTADQAAYLASKLGMELVMGETRPYGAGIYGNAVLTRLPVIGSARHDLSHGLREPRGCLRVDVAVNDVTLHVFNCHFGLAFRERRAQLELLAGFIRAGSCPGPRVVMGDFNEWHRGPVPRGLRLEFESPMRRMRRTHPAVFPIFRLDRLYSDVELEREAFHVHSSGLARVASDHLPVMVRLRVRRRVGAPYVMGDALPPAE